MRWLRKRQMRRDAAAYQERKDLRDLIRSVLREHDRDRDAAAIKFNQHREIVR